MFPCNECAKLLIQAGITEVVFHENKPSAPRRAVEAQAAAAVAVGAPGGRGPLSSSAAAVALSSAVANGAADGPDAAAMAARLAGSGDEEDEEGAGEDEGAAGAAEAAEAAAARADVCCGHGSGGADQDPAPDGLHPDPHHHHMSPEDAVYAASRRLLALAGVKVRQHALVRRIAMPPVAAAAAAAGVGVPAAVPDGAVGVVADAAERKKKRC